MLSWLAAFTLLTFIATIFLVLKSPSIKIPFTSRRIKIDYGLAPPLCALILIATPSSLPTLTLLREGLLGCSYIRPYSIIIFILSLSYICISLDCTGFFKYISLRVAKAAGSSGIRLFIYLFIFTSLLTMFTSNDVVILTVTYIVLYICTYAGVDPFPYLIAQFFAANISSMGLYIGNPTNIVIADAFGIIFTEFARWMLLPAILASFTCMSILLLIFGRILPKKIIMPEVDPRSFLNDRRGAIFDVTMLVSMLMLISLPNEWTSTQVWLIALAFALLTALHDLIYARPRVGIVIRRMPWKIAPFLIGLFIIVEAMAFSGWINIVASRVSEIISREVSVGIFGLSLISALGASLMNNHTMTVFFVKVIKESLGAQFSEIAQTGAIFALVIGSNLGANCMLTGSLAGLMWSKILSEKGLKISHQTFFKYGFIVMIPVTLVVSLSLAAMINISLQSTI